MKKLLFFISAISITNFSIAQSVPEGLFIGSRSPDFRAKDQYGQEVRLKDFLKKGKVILLFYRGFWSPDCNRELRNFQDSLQLIKDKGAILIAVTPENKESISKTIEKTSARFSILFDDEIKIMKAYDVAYEVPENTIKRYRSTDIDLEKDNGKNWKYLPVPAVYIIDKEVTVTYRFFDMDYKKRPSVAEILKNLQ